MGLRFRKSIKMGPVRINLSKSGVGYSVGVKGYRVTKTATGRTRTTVSIPGTGISHVTETSSKRPNSSVQQPAAAKKDNPLLGMLLFFAIVILLFAAICYLAVIL